jgi:imidazolonepropionase-like amidohydrolase
MKMLAALMVVAAALAGCGSSERVEGDLVVTAKRVFDGRQMLENGVVVVRSGTIVAVGSQEDVDASAPKRVDLGDGTLLPGLIDLHVHDLGRGQHVSAVTTVRDVGAAEVSLTSVRKLERGAPRVLFSGPLLTVPRGYPTQTFPDVAGVVRGVAGARAAVARLAGEGVSVIKIALERGPGTWPILSRAQIEAIVEEAHTRGLPVTAHVSSTELARLALETGVDELAHMPCEGHDPRVMPALVKAGVEIVGTLHVHDANGCSTAAYARAFVDAGGTLLYGSDYPNSPIPPGVDVDELRLMAAAGLTSLEVLTNATARAGEQLRIAKLGTLQEGAPADLVGVSGNPLADLEALKLPELVVVRGVVVVDGGRIVTPS